MGFRDRLSRRHPAEDSDSDTDLDVETQELAPTEAQKNECFRRIQMVDLSTDTRDKITSDDNKARRVNLKAIYDSRECNIPGTEAALRAAKHKGASMQWNNFSNTSEAQEGVTENIRDIAGGNSHRPNVLDQRRSEEEALGRSLTLEDTYDDRRRRGTKPPVRSSRGGSHAVANDRGNFSAARGGGNAGRGPGRALAASSSRPLDPAVDPTRVYGYNDKVRWPRTDSKPVDVRPKNIFRAAPSRLPTGLKDKSNKGKEIPNVGNVKASSPLVSNGNIPILPRQPPTEPTREISSSSVSTSSHTRPTQPRGTLAAPGDFMSFVRTSQVQTTTTAAGTASFAVAKPAVTKLTQGLAASKYAPQAAEQSAENKTTRVHSLSRADFRDPDLSPAQLTDALPSTGQLSFGSPSVESDGLVKDINGGVGLGIRIPDTSVSSCDVKAKTSTDSADLMDADISDVEKPVLVPTPTSATHNKNQVLVSKEEKERLSAIEAYKAAGDAEGLLDLLGMTIPSLNTQSAVPSAEVTDETTETDVEIADTKVEIVNANIEVAEPCVPFAEANRLQSSSFNLGIVGNSHVLSRITGTQTTPSLAASIWASPTILGIRSDVLPAPALQKPVKKSGSTFQPPLSPVTTSSESQLVYKVPSRPADQAFEAGMFAFSIATEDERVSWTRPDVDLVGEMEKTSKLTTLEADHHDTQPFGSRIQLSHHANPFIPRETVNEGMGATLDYSSPICEKVPKTTSSFQAATTVTASPATLAAYHPAISFETQITPTATSLTARPMVKPKPRKRLDDSQWGPKAKSQQIDTDPQKVVNSTTLTTTSNAITADSLANVKAPPRRKSSSKPGLAASIYADPVMSRAAPTLKDKSANQGLNGFGRMRAAQPDLKYQPDLLGDSFNISRLPQSDPLAVRMQAPRASHLRKKTGNQPISATRVAPGPGYLQLMRDVGLGRVQGAELTGTMQSAESSESEL